MSFDSLRAVPLGLLSAIALLLVTPPPAEASPQAGCTLRSDVERISLASGGEQVLSLTIPGEPTVWQIVGSASGDSPGHLFMGVTPMALNVDRYFVQTLGGIHRLIRPAVGVTDASGHATSSIVVPPGASPALVGTTLHHAFFVLDPLTLLPACTSNSVPVTLVP